MRLRNDTGHRLDAIALGRSIGPGEEFEHDVEHLGDVPGCVPVEASADPPGDGAGDPQDEQDPPAKPSRARAAAKAKEAGE